MPQTNTGNRRSKNIPNIKRMAKIGIFTAILALLSQIAIPLPGGVPVTLQTFAVCLCGYFLGKKDGLCSLCVYVMLGICGAPVFTGFSGGFYHFLGGTGGFIIGFIILAFLCGLGITENENPVEKYIDKKRRDGADKRQFDLPYTAQHNGTGQRQSHTKIGGQQPIQIRHAIGDNFRIVGIDPHNQIRSEPGSDGEDRSKDQAKAQHDGNGFSQAVLILHPPKPGSKHRSPHSQAHTANLKDVDKLAGQRRRG